MAIATDAGSDSRIPAWALTISPSAQNEIPEPYGRQRPWRHVTSSGCVSTWARSCDTRRLLPRPGSPTIVANSSALVGDGAVERADERAELVGPADERAGLAARDVDAEGRPRRDRVEDADRLGLALQDGRRELRRSRTGGSSPASVSSPTATPSSGATDWIREAVLTLSPARNRSPAPGARSSRTRASPVLIPIRSRSGAPLRALEPGRLVGDPEGRADGSLGVVAVRDRHAEDADDGVADELLDDAAVELDLGARRLRSSG